MEGFIPKKENTIEDQEEALKWGLVNIQLEYIEKLDSQDIKDDKLSFEEMILRYSDVSDIINIEYDKRMGGKIIVPITLLDFRKIILNQIKVEYKEDKKTWKTIVKTIIEEASKQLGPVLEDYQKEVKDFESKRKWVRTITYDIRQEYNLQEYGINEYDNCMEVHLKDLFKQKAANNSVKNIFSGDSLTKLAELIVDEYPSVKAIIAKSWIVDSPIGQRMGFTTYFKNTQPSAGFQFWGQFITEDGTLNEDKIKKFLETGKADYYIAYGLIKTEDFLKKYLPAEKRGTIQLQDTNPEYFSKMKLASQRREYVLENIYTITSDEVNEIFKNDEGISQFMNTEDGKEFVEIIHKSILNKQHPYAYDMKGWEKAVNNFHSFFENDKSRYITKEVII